MAEPLLIAKNGTTDVVLFPALANRHGLITGATGTGKTVTLQRLAEGFSTLGVPVFLADVKGDLAGIAAAGTLSPKLSERLKVLQIEHFEPHACPAALWDVFGELGHPVRATISDMGPLLLTRLLNLNETQAGVLQLAFKVADDNGLLLLDLKDLRAMLKYVADHAADLKEYGNVSTASVGAIQRGLLAVEQEGAERFFGEPMLDIADLMQTDADGHGVVNILAAEKLYGSPKLYAAFLLWLLSELFEHLPEVGDLAVPKLVFFFDEAHLLFESAPEALLTKIEQVVRLIRSKGVGIYFVTQSPLDVPDSVLGQLGNRIQHALRAASVRDQKAVRAAADTLPQNSALDLRTAITELAVGEALISCLDEQGRPTKTERAWVVPPSSRLGPITGAERKAILDASLVAGHYEQVLDRESAYERLRDAVSAPAAAKVSATAPAQAGPPAPTGGAASDSPFGGALNGILFGTTGPRGGKHDGLAQLAAKSVVRSVGSSLGRDLVRGVLGSLMGTSRRR